MKKHCIPLQRIEQVEIEITAFDLKTNYFNFDISFKGVTDTKIRLTAGAIFLINDTVKDIIKNLRGMNKCKKSSST